MTLSGIKKPPFLPPPSQERSEVVGGLLLIMPVMTAPANHTHYSAWTGTLIIARFIYLFMPPNFNMSIEHRVLRI